MNNTGHYFVYYDISICIVMGWISCGRIYKCPIVEYASVDTKTKE